MLLILKNLIPAEWKGKVTFDLQLFPVTYSGKTYHLGDQFGIFPVEGLDKMVAGAGGIVQSRYLWQPAGSLLIAPEDPLCKLEIEQLKGDLSLIDDRNSSLGRLDKSTV